MKRFRRVMVWFMLATALAGTSARAQLQVGLNFTGAAFNKPVTRGAFAPAPNIAGAVGQNHVVQMTNGRFMVFNKSNGSLVKNQTLINFWTGLGTNPRTYTYDPRIVYDKYTSRWFATSLENPGAPNRFLLGVSKTSDPTGGWNAFGIASDPSNQFSADYDRLGIDRDGIYLVANMFPLSGSASPAETVVVIPKSDLTKANPTVARATTFANVPFADPNGFIGAGTSPIVNYDNSSMPHHLLADTAVNTGTLYMNEIRGSIDYPVLRLDGTYISSTPYDSPPPAYQYNDPNGLNLIDTGDETFRAPPVQVNGKIWAVHSVGVNGRSALHWLQIDPVSNTVLQEGLLSDPSLSLYYGSIAVNSFGDVVIGANGSSVSQPVSSYAFLGRTNGSTTSFSTKQLLKAGTGTFNKSTSGPETWGSQSATLVDPSDPSRFWTMQEIANGADNWVVQITQLIVPGRAALASVPEPSTAALAMTGVAALGWLTRRHRRRG